MTAATARQTSPRKGWVNHVPSHRLRQPRAMDPKSKPLDAEERAYIEFADDLRKDRPYFTERPDVLAALMGFGRGPAAIRKLQRLEARMEANKQIRRVLIPGRPDLVSGRDTFTGRIGVIPLVTRTELPIVGDYNEVARLDASMRERARQRQRTLALRPADDAIVARQICRATSASCTSNLTPHSPPTEGLERVTETTTYARDPEPSSSFLDCVQDEPTIPEPEAVTIPEPTSTPAAVDPPTPTEVPAADPGGVAPASLVIRLLAVLVITRTLAAAKIREWVRVHGLEKVHLVLTLAEHRKPTRNPFRCEGGIGWVLTRWRTANMSLEAIREEVSATEPRPKPGAAGSLPVMQNLNAPAPIEPDSDPAATEATLSGGWRSWGRAAT
jgi:hypothetical protein